MLGNQIKNLAVLSERLGYYWGRYQAKKTRVDYKSYVLAHRELSRLIEAVPGFKNIDLAELKPYEKKETK